MFDIQALKSKLSLPVIQAPMYGVSGPDLVINACLNGVIGSFPSFNAKSPEELDAWLTRMRSELDKEKQKGGRPAPFALNMIVHPTNTRLEPDMKVCEAHKVPLVITSVGLNKEIIERIKTYGGTILHDVATVKHVDRVLESGVDALILLCAGAGGVVGNRFPLNPFSFLAAVRKRFNGPIILSGGITDGRAVRAVEVAGADLAYMGTRFMATRESMAGDFQKRLLLDGSTDDIVCTDKITGVFTNMLPAVKGRPIPQIAKGGKPDMTLFTVNQDKIPWKDLIPSGQGVGNIDDIPATSQLIERLKKEYEAVC